MKPTVVKFINKSGQWVEETCHDISTCREHSEKIRLTEKLLKQKAIHINLDDDSTVDNAMSIFDEPTMNRETFLSNVEKLNRAAEAYYAGTEQFMTDIEYDVLLEEVESAAQANGWTEAENLTSRVAAGFAAGTEVKHVKPMLSMAKVKDINELEAFAEKVGGYTLEPKLDGLAVSLTYKKGKLVGAATRGDGHKGESILPQILRNKVRNLDYTLSEEVDLIVRGELYMTHKDFEEANKERIRRTGQPFANSRNATAGIIRNQKEEDAYAVLSFAAYDVVNMNEDSYEKQLEHLESLGFKTSTSLLQVEGDTLAEKVANFGTQRESLDYPVDGIVLKANSMKVREKLGEGSKTPNWAMAYKYSDEQKVTMLIDIERAVGRTGAISYTAILEPVQLEGTTVTRATLNNANYIRDNNIKVGGKVVIQKANMIIPQIVSGYDNASVPAYNAPTTCPNCQQELDTKTSIVWRCVNPDCSTLQALTFFTGRDFMDIEGLSESTLTYLIDSGKVNDPADLYSLSVQELANLKVDAGKNSSLEYRLLGNKVAEKLHAQIQKSKEQDFSRVLPSLNIRHLGRRLGKRIADKFPTMELLQNASVEDLMTVEGIARDKAEAIHDGLKQRATVITKLKAAGVNMGTAAKKEVKTAATPSGLSWIIGKTFVITGSIEGMNRNTIQERLEELGGKAQSSVSSKTDFLIVGENAGSKLAKAQSLGVTIKQANEVIAALNA